MKGKIRSRWARDTGTLLLQVVVCSSIVRRERRREEAEEMQNPRKQKFSIAQEVHSMPQWEADGAYEKGMLKKFKSGFSIVVKRLELDAWDPSSNPGEWGKNFQMATQRPLVTTSDGNSTIINPWSKWIWYMKMDLKSVVDYNKKIISRA